MTFWKLIFRSLLFYYRSNLSVILGTMIGAAVLTGALIIGDSMQFSLNKIVFDRLGKTDFALYSADRTFEIGIASDMSKNLNTKVAPLLQSRGIVVVDGGRLRITNVQILGVNPAFGIIGETPDLYDNLSLGEVIISKTLAARSNLKTGDNMVLRIQIPNLIPLETSLSIDKKRTIARPFKIKGIAGQKEFGNFNLKTSQTTSNTVFLSISYLSKLMGIADRANLLLFAERKQSPLKQKEIMKSFKSIWQPLDAGLIIKSLKNGKIQEIKSERIFIDPPIEKIIKETFSQNLGILTYFVNKISLDKRSTPYSFISSPPNSSLFVKLKEDEILINEWLATDLNASMGDILKLSYYIINNRGQLEETTRPFIIKSLLPMKPPFLNPNLMPDYPGLSDAENCRDWNPGIPLELNNIRGKDEKYWEKYRGSPKGFISLNSAQKMWKNSFGKLTSIRLTGYNPEQIWKKIQTRIKPELLGFKVVPVKNEGLKASMESIDFSTLFLGLSFFIIVSALLLLGLLFVFAIAKRGEEKGLLSALGFPKKTIRNLMWTEGGILAFLGSFFGLGLAILYTHLILWALKVLWYEVAGTTALHIYIRPLTLLMGLIISCSMAFIIMSVVAKNLIKGSINQTQRGLEKFMISSKKNPFISKIISIIGSISILVLLILTKFGAEPGEVLFFFIGGPVFIITGLAIFHVYILNLKRVSKENPSEFYRIGLRNLAGNSKRTLSLTALLACGIFIVFTVGANKKNAFKDFRSKESGTGGFVFYAETTIPIFSDLSTMKGREKLGLNREIMKHNSYLSFQMKEGDDASCLNLNRITHPTLIGINPQKLSDRGAFTFSAKSELVNPDNPWESLNMILPDESIPAIADQTVIKWSLGKKVNDKLTYINERGKTIKIKLVAGLSNSIFQGKIIISTSNLKKHFPSISGYRLFLIDTVWDKTEKIESEFRRILEDYGLEIRLASKKLNEFNQVENTYLAIFLILGSFGILLGSIGLGIVIWKNITERKGELAILRALGFNLKTIRRMIVIEHLVIFGSGVFIGLFSALLATLPGFFTPGAQVPIITLLLILVLIIINGFGWIYISVRMSISKKIISALRND